MHGFDRHTPIEETLSTLDNMITSGKVRYIGCSNFFAWQVMKTLSASEKNGWEKYIVYQGYYSLIGRDYEWELMPMLQDQGMGLMVWSPLGWGRLTGKIRYGQPLPEGRIKSGGSVNGPQVTDRHLFTVLKALEEVSEETGKTVPQVALNWLMLRPTVSNIIIGARNEIQLVENLGAVGWNLTLAQMEKLDEASAQNPIYPVWVGQR
jgi:aryl-alcohol dehydrogenase-like predicted oxidoreductase